MESEAKKIRKRPRRWSVAEKEELIAKSDDPDSFVREVAREHGVHPNLLSCWRAQRDRGLLGSAPGGIVAVRVSELPEVLPAATSGAPSGVIEIVLGRCVLRVDGAVDSAALRRVLDVVGR